MALVSSVVCTPDATEEKVVIRRDGEADLELERAWQLLEVSTAPRNSLIHNPGSGPGKRWKVYRLYGTRRIWAPIIKEHFDHLVVAEEGHSTLQGEKVRYSATICSNPVEAWTAMGKLDELKESFAELDLPVVQKL